MIEVGSKVVSVVGSTVTFDNGVVARFEIKRPKGKTVPVFAFTGMKLGDLEIVKETSKYLEVRKSNGKTMKFDKKTGLQVDCKNPRFANRLHA
jgi:hypothetical protein